MDCIGSACETINLLVNQQGHISSKKPREERNNAEVCKVKEDNKVDIRKVEEWNNCIEFGSWFKQVIEEEFNPTRNTLLTTEYEKTYHFPNSWVVNCKSYLMQAYRGKYKGLQLSTTHCYISCLYSLFKLYFTIMFS